MPNWNFLLLRHDVALSLPCWLSQFRKAKLRQPTGQRQSNVRMQNFFLIGPILFWYYEESLVSSNLNSNLLRFHCAHPNVHVFKIPVGKRRKEIAEFFNNDIENSDEKSRWLRILIFGCHINVCRSENSDEGWIRSNFSFH